mmetsp:Transcript_77116/g.249800  ORF Transcript_77116/g.249800 Transcript_77116/m.249800 type:complete len:546 (-) Transcript_77116:242-1879(-)
MGLVSPFTRTMRGGNGPNGPIAQKDLFFLVRDASTEDVLKVLANGLVDPNAKYSRPLFQDLMFFAAARDLSKGGAAEIAMRLAALGVPTGSRGSMWQTPLFYASREGNVECAAFLVERGCEVNRTDINGQTPVFYSVREGHLDMTKFLARKGAALNMRDTKGLLPSDYGAKSATAAAPPQQAPLTRVALRVKSMAQPGPLMEFWNRSSMKKTSEEFRAEAATDGANGGGASGSSSSSTTCGDGGGSSSSSSAAENAAAEAEAEVPTKRRRLTKAEDSRMQAAQEEDGKTLGEAMIAWAAGEPNARDAASKAPIAAFKPPASNKLARAPNASDVLTEKGDYYVCYPSVADAARLRELERDFVVEHAEMCQVEPWYSKQTPADWCGLVNVIIEEGSALQAIRSIVTGATPNHSTLCCVHRGRGEGTEGRRTIVGYIHTYRDSNVMDVSHLKVERAHQGKGLGGLLLAGAVRTAIRLEWSVQRLRLIVLERNKRAIQLYSRLGFSDSGGMKKSVRVGSRMCVTWTRMGRVMSEGLAEFAEACEKGVRE